MRIDYSTNEGKVMAILLGIVGLALATFLLYKDLPLWCHNRCAIDQELPVERISGDSTTVSFVISPGVTVKRDGRQVFKYLEGAEYAFISYCQETESLIIYQFDKWKPNWLIELRTLLITFLSLLIISGLFRG